MDKTVVISQPMFFPWIGLFEQVALADVFVHYDDVQMPQGRSFMSRVQLRDASGQFWLSGQIDRKGSGRLISDTHLVGDDAWRKKHLKTISHLYKKAPHFAEAFDLIEEIYGVEENNLARFNALAIEKITEWFDLDVVFKRSSEMNVPGSSSQRLFDICKKEQAQSYVTGHGALNYLNHELFDGEGIQVCYMDYQKREYTQLHSPFIPYVSIIDVMSNLGKNGRDYMVSKALYWKEYIDYERDRKV